MTAMPTNEYSAWLFHSPKAYGSCNVAESMNSKPTIVTAMHEPAKSQLNRVYQGRSTRSEFRQPGAGARVDAPAGERRRRRRRGRSTGAAAAGGSETERAVAGSGCSTTGGAGGCSGFFAAGFMPKIGMLASIATWRSCCSKVTSQFATSTST